MSVVEPVDIVLQKTLRAAGEEFYIRFLKQSIFARWAEIVGESNSRHWLPVLIKEKTLFVKTYESAWLNELTFYKKEIIGNINRIVTGGEFEIVNEIKPAPVYEKPSKTTLDLIDGNFGEPPPPEKLPGDLRKVNLTDEEISEIENLAELKNIVTKTLINRLKLEKLRIKNGWHKCKKCNSLCPPEKIFCDLCYMTESGEMRRKIRQVFTDAPWLSFPAVRREVLKTMPHMKNECTLSVIASERATLLNRIAGRIPFGDKTSPDAMTLVMLKKQVEPENLTPKLIDAALKEMFFSRADRPFKG